MPAPQTKDFCTGAAFAASRGKPCDTLSPATDADAAVLTGRDNSMSTISLLKTSLLARSETGFFSNQAPHGVELCKNAGGSKTSGSDGSSGANGPVKTGEAVNHSN